MFMFGLLVSLLSLPVFSATFVSTQIHDIDYGTGPQDEILLFLNSGQVAKIKADKSVLFKPYLENKDKSLTFDFELDQHRHVLRMEQSKLKPPIPSDEFMPSEVEKNTYVPTTIESMSVAKKYFSEGRHSPKDSQCFNRAMVWGYEWYKNHSVRSNKILIFFTRNYIRRYDFEWWFHIAPYVHVQDENKVVERVMDVKYSSGPIEFRRWTNIFMNKDTECKVITKYSEYADYPYTGECYIIRTNMYTYQPADLQMNEAWNYTKTKFVYEEVKGAYLEAFDISI